MKFDIYNDGLPCKIIALFTCKFYLLEYVDSSQRNNPKPNTKMNTSIENQNKLDSLCWKALYQINILPFESDGKVTTQDILDTVYYHGNQNYVEPELLAQIEAEFKRQGLLPAALRPVVRVRPERRY